MLGSPALMFLTGFTALVVLIISVYAVHQLSWRTARFFARRRTRIHQPKV
ncbi:MAG: hypothetical protein AAFY22_02090 [Pseudomonadota bacterium]